MGPKRTRQGGAAEAAPAAQNDVDPRSELIGRFLGVPTDFFGVIAEGERYLARVTQKHPTQKTMVWLKFEADNKEVFVPFHVAAKWVITDEEAENEDTEWYQVPSDDESEEEDDDEPHPAARAQAAAPAARAQAAVPADERLRGKVENGKWKPTRPADPPHAIDNLTWRKASGAVPSHTPLIFDREPPEGKQLIEPGLREPLDPKRPVMLQLFERQWDRSIWVQIQKYSRVRSKYLGLGTADATSHKPNISKRNGDSSKGHVRPKPLYSLPFLIRLHVIIRAMGIMRLPGRKYYWKTGAFVGCKAIKDLMTQKQFDQGMRGLYACDHTQQIYRGDWKKPPPEGYDKLFKTRELDSAVMRKTLTAYAPRNRFSNDECSEPKLGKNGEGAAVSFNKDKPNK